MNPSDPRAASRADRAKLVCVKIWAVVGVIVVAAAALALLGHLSSVLMFLSVGCIVAYVASPLVNWLSSHRIPRGVAAIVGVLVVAAGVVLLFALLIPLFLSQMTDLLSSLPAKISEMGQWVSSIQQDHELLSRLSAYVDVDSAIRSAQATLTSAVTGMLSAIGTGIVPAVGNIASMVFVVFLGLVLAYWIALDYPIINREICLALGESRSRDYRVLVAVISRSVGGYLRSTVIDSFIQGTLAFIGFLIVGHPYAGIMGVLSGVLNFVPVVGPSISAIVATGVALFYSPSMALGTMIAAMVAQNVTDNVIVPRINQSTMQIHPVLSLTALMIGSTLLGTLGMIVAIPLCAIAKGLFIFYFESRTGTQVVSYDGALFKGTPYHDVDGMPVPACDALGDDRDAPDSKIVPPMPHATADPRPSPASGGIIKRALGRLRK